MNHPEIILVLARAANGVIGKDGGMPWHLPADLRHFKQITKGRPMIMGRKTFDSLPGLLDGLGNVWRLVAKQLMNPHRGPARLEAEEAAEPRDAGDSPAVPPARART